MKPSIAFCWLTAALAAQEPAPETPAQRFVRGVAEYRAGRFAAAFAELSAASEAFGADAPDELRLDLALAALRVQRPADAEAQVRPLLETPRPALRARAEFVLALASHQRCEQALAAARLADAEPLAWQTAQRAIEAAHRGFCRAATAAPPWPEALRNAERAWQLRAEILRLAAEDRARRAPNEREPEPPRREPPAPAPEPPQEIEPELVAAPLPPAEVERLLQRVRQKEREKLRERTAAQRERAVAGERDW